MTINHYVFSSLMKNGICCNMKSCLIITELKSSHEMSNLKILKQREITSDLTSGDSHDSILSFGRRSRDNGLLLGMPRNERSPKKMQKPVTDLWVSEHPAQSESQNPLSCMGFVEEKNKPCPEVPLRYCRT